MIKYHTIGLKRDQTCAAGSTSDEDGEREKGVTWRGGGWRVRESR